MKRVSLFILTVLILFTITSMRFENRPVKMAVLNSKDSSSFIIHSCKKESPTYIDSVYQSACNDWILTVKDIEDVLINSEVIEEVDVHNEFYTLQCYYKGRLSYKGNEYACEVTAGSYSVLYNRDTCIYLGYFKDKNYFIEKPEKPESK